MPPLQARLLQDVPSDSAVVADSVSLADSASLADRLSTDSTLYRLSNPIDTASEVYDRLSAQLLDATLWYGLTGLLLKTILILGLVLVAIGLIDRATARWKRRFEDLPAVHPRRQRAFTIGNLLSSAARYVLWPVGIIMALSEIGIDVGALIATAGIAGLAIGFGAQTLVKDVISGVFLLFDDTIHVGDLVRVGSDTGVVEYIGVRVIRVRRFDGEVMMIPAGELRIFGNRSVDYARVIVNVSLSYEQDVDTILPVMDRVAAEWADDYREIVLEEKPQVQALTEFGDSGVTARVVVQVIPGEQFEAERELRVRLKRTFDELGIEIPFPRRTLYLRQEDDRPRRVIVDHAEGDEALGSE